MSEAFTRRAVQLRAELREALPKDLILTIVEFVAASELGLSELECEDSNALRLTVAREALNVLGCSDKLIDIMKAKLAGAPAQPQSLRSH